MNTNANADELRELMHQTWGDVPLADQKRLLALFRVSNDPYHDQAFGDLSHVEKLTIVANHQLEACQWKDAYRTITAIERIERRRPPQALAAVDLARLRLGPEPQPPPAPEAAREAAREAAPQTLPSPAPATTAPAPVDVHSARARRALTPREREAARRAAQSARDRAFRQSQTHTPQPVQPAGQQPHVAPASSHPPFT